MKTPTLYVIIGRFQPFHKGHAKMVQAAVNMADNEDHVAIIIGSQNTAKSIDNPLSYDEREKMLWYNHCEYNEDFLSIHGMKDYFYEDAYWSLRFTERVSEIGKQVFGDKPYNVNFLTSSKGNDAALREEWASLQGGWKVTNVTSIPPYYIAPDQPLSATTIREMIAQNPTDYMKDIKPYLTGDTIRWIEFNKGCFDTYLEEIATVKKYKEMWKDAPFPPTFMATDAVVRDSTGRYLFIKRGGEMGTGTIALAGGFLEANLTHEDNMKKELLEETNLDLSKTPHKIVVSWFCDSVSRSWRGRMTTMVFLVQLQDSFDDHPEIAAGDDASQVVFMTKDMVNDSVLFSDHYGLFNKVLALECRGESYIVNH